MDVMKFSFHMQAENLSLFHWVRRELHACFDFIMHEPPPAEMLDLLDSSDRGTP